ncbi:hypothetical protein FQA39_LY18715 [Lamprigera yunnana]|nr:hypothetical protein FQA39_LY18715 [Lamprigera yunnana]
MGVIIAKSYMKYWTISGVRYYVKKKKECVKGKVEIVKKGESADQKYKKDDEHQENLNLSWQIFGRNGMPRACNYTHTCGTSKFSNSIAPMHLDKTTKPDGQPSPTYRPTEQATVIAL